MGKRGRPSDERDAASPLAVRLLGTFIMFTVLAGQFWRNLLGWWGFGAIAIVSLLLGLIALAVLRPHWGWRSIPKPLAAFLLIATASIVWSYYQGASAIGLAILWTSTIAALFLALTLSWAELVRALATALRWALALSLAFELAVSTLLGHAMLPFWVSYPGDKQPLEFYWSRGLLLDGGPIEGIVASHNLLGFLALLALIIFLAQIVASVRRHAWGGGLWHAIWLLVALLTLALTGSATVIVASALVFVVFVFAVWARYSGRWGLRAVYLMAAASVAGATFALLTYTPQILGALGRSQSLTGRTTIWANVVELAQERPLLGWGWVGYWAPWVDPFQDIYEHGGVVYLQAHNAWLDVWLQTGLIGVLAFTALALSTLGRSWLFAIRRPPALTPPSTLAPFSMVPLLLTTALLAQGLAESRLLIEYGWVLLVVLAVVTKRRQKPQPAPQPSVPKDGPVLTDSAPDAGSTDAPRRRSQPTETEAADRVG
jgi:O-antigen ligase